MNTVSTNRNARARSLLEKGDQLASQKHMEAAEACFIEGLTLQPANPNFLRNLGSLYQAHDRQDDALLCFRGVIPDAVNDKFFDAENLSKQLVSSEYADSVTNLTGHTSENLPLQRPIIHESEELRPQFKQPQTEHKGTHVSILGKGEVWFDRFNTLAINRHKEILTDHIKGNHYLAWKKTRESTPTTLEGRACFLEARSSTIYYHWMLDVLPKFGVLEKCGISIESIDWFIVDSASQFQRETLALLGIPEEKLVSPRQSPYFRAEELLIPYLKNDIGEKVYRGLGFGLGSWVPDFLQRSFLSKHHPASSPAERIYISRENGDSRAINDEQGIQSVLKSYGFKSVQFENLTIAEQANIMRTAEMVVAPHGAGLTNLAYCQNGTRVLELFGNYIVPCYWALSNLCRLEYHQYFVSSNTAARDPLPAKSLVTRRKANLDLDPAQLDKVLSVFTA